MEKKPESPFLLSFSFVRKLNPVADPTAHNMCHITRYEYACVACGRQATEAKNFVFRCKESSCRFRGDRRDNIQEIKMPLEVKPVDNQFCAACRHRRRARRAAVSEHLSANFDRFYRDDIETTYAKHKAYLENIGKVGDGDDADKEKEKKVDDDAGDDADDEAEADAEETDAETDVTYRIPGAFCTEILNSPEPCTLL